METAALNDSEPPQLAVARLLVEALEHGDGTSAEHLVKELATVRERDLFQEVGKLTRELHDALKNVRVDHEMVELAENEIPDTKERLNYVIQKTEEAAHRTLNAVEESLPLTEGLQEEAGALNGDWDRFRRRERGIDEFKVFGDRLEAFLQKTGSTASDIQGKLSEVLMAQDFQDLTGQVIRQVMDLVQNVESQLIGVIQRTSDAQPGIKAEGPQVTSGGRAKSVSSQEEADDILASLGF
jgi:chemotaxis protein CheZ